MLTSKQKWYRRKFKIKDINNSDFLKECIVCKGRTGLVIHHKDLNDKNNDSSNFITMCRYHHYGLHMLIAWRKRLKGFEYLIV